MDVSVLMPAYNEADNLAEVVPECLKVLERLGAEHEIVVVDDGSNDDTTQVMVELMRRHDAVRHVRLRRNLGKSAALQVGLNRVTGARVLLMDADGQDDPEAIPALWAAVDGGIDQVTGRRAERNDRFIKRSTSKVYNWATSKATGVDGRDFNSGLKLMTADVASSLQLYGELHRYIPVLAHWAGFTVGEVEVPHRHRLHGQTKFGRARFWRGFLDLMTVKFLTTYTSRPFHLFGGMGTVLSSLGVLLLAWMAVVKVLGDPVGDRPALLVGILFVVVGVQLASIGLIAELFVHQRVDRPPDDYAVEEGL